MKDKEAHAKTQRHKEVRTKSANNNEAVDGCGSSLRALASLREFFFIRVIRVIRGELLLSARLERRAGAERAP
jgi:hypothetical protein